LLRIKRLELQGFKSFGDRTELRFNGSGIAAIVGPNGCGKSNLSDAISWVLGEQSAKLLRGSRMEDVIFAGTRERKPLGMASVTMTLVDPAAHQDSKANGRETADGDHGDSPAEVTITRRLFRSGDSEYLINGRMARLRDIQDIFMGTGLGPECYAIIEQGRIGQILSSRPQDRRAVIEEAAGVTRYKSKRRLAEAKLEGAKQNLTRVFDILEEVGRQVNSLKRQAAKARRFEELKAEMNARLRRLLSGRYRLLERDAAKTALDLNMAAAAFQGISTEVAEREAEHSRLQAESYQTESELTQARGRRADLELEAERTRSRIQNQAQQIASIELRVTQAQGESQDLCARITGLETELAGHAERVVEVDRHVESSRARLAVKSEEKGRVQETLRSREHEIESSRQHVLRLLGEASTLQNQLAQIDEYLAAVEREAAKAQKEEQTAVSDLEWLTAGRNEVHQKMAARQLELESLAERRQRAEAELADRRTKAAEARRQLDQLRGEFSNIKARRDSLDEILSHRAYTTEAVKRLFTAIDQGQAHDLRPLGVLADFVEVDPAYEKAAEEFLHDELEYVVVENWQEAEHGVDLLRRDLEGRATFLVHDGQVRGPAAAKAETPVPLGPETGIVARLSDVLRFTNGLNHAPAELLPRLARCFLVRDRAAAQRLAPQYPALYFLAPDGVCYSAQAVSGGKKTGSGPLALKRELRELTALVQTKQRDLDLTSTVLENLERELALLEEDVERLRSSQQGQEKEALALDHEMRRLTEEVSRANSKLSVARLELGRLRQAKEQSLAQRESNRQSIAERDQERHEQEQALAASRSEMENLQAEASRLGEEHAALRAELAGLEERARSEQAVRVRLESQLAELAARRQEIAAELERLGGEKTRLLADNIELDRRASSLSEQISEAETAVNRLAEQETQSRAALADLEDALKQKRVEMQEAQEKRSQVELELVKRQAELRFLDETSRKDLDAPIEEVAQAEETVPDEPGIADAEKSYQEVKARLEAMGPVNPQALEEYQEAKQRYDFLNTQRQDLLDSIRDTEKAIHDIDVESRRRFSEAFGAVNANFREAFKTLFGGGVGEMRLTDESNVGESGIDIVASPPGKRLQNVLLLSGGEKALTALALLIAIFRYQPSPFCILDEVDAPLDEPNIQRLTRLLREMSAQTQFVLITHAKRTMEVAEALYGVTMQEPGVSKLVSVRFQPAPPVAERSAAMATAATRA
jgi:chromosome segregation protein